MSESPPIGLDRIGQIAVTAHDLERAVAFYRDRLGMRLLFQVPKMAFFQCGEITVMLALPDAPAFDHPASIVYYTVDDIDAAHRALTDRGVAFVRAPALTHRAQDHELWMAFFTDSEGNTAALMARKRLDVGR
jgi:predicted enzyme related to lactoylglutathione lyase